MLPETIYSDIQERSHAPLNTILESELIFCVGLSRLQLAFIQSGAGASDTLETTSPLIVNSG